jgi:formate dehydrogenase iron-sulfur subunit
MIMEGDPFVLIEGMAIAGLAPSAHQGLRLYPLGISARHRGDEAAIAAARAGISALRSWARPCFDIEVRVGAGAYVCGEETAC